MIWCGEVFASIEWPHAGLSTTQAGAPATLSSSQPARSSVTESPAHDEDDLACVQRVGRGDQRAFRVLVDRYLAAITRFALRTLGDRAEAEEVAQETFLRLWTAAAEFEPHALPKTWLYRIARNQCIDRIRKRRAHGQEVELQEHEAGEDRPSALLLRKQIAAQVGEALATLPERQREAITLVHYEGLSGAEACDVLSVSAEALESLLARGRRALREQLRDVAKREGS